MRRELDNAQKIACTVLRYLQEHPAAKDTLEGIAQWWLLREGTEQALANVEEALSILLEESLVVSTQREGLATYYGLNLEKEEEMLRFLQTRCESEEGKAN